MAYTFSQDPDLERWVREYQREDSWPIQLLDAYGESFAASALPPDISAMDEHDCYLNAFGLASADPDRFTYYEGAGTLQGEGYWYPHAWCVDARGNVVDPTWHSLPKEPVEYRGLPVPLDLVEPHATSESFGTLYAYRDKPDEFARRLGLAAI